MRRYVVPIFLVLFVMVGCSQKECKPPELAKANLETMSFIPGGKFIMGDGGDKFGDKPLKGAYVSSFYLDKSEVTNAMYREYIGANKCIKAPKYLEDPTFGADNLPVVNVSYKDAKNFCRFYSKRLATEAEWEYAARGRLKNKKYPWGNRADRTQMNYRGSDSSWAMPVKSYPPNKYGLYDMSGNVREWVEDTYSKNFYRCSKRSKVDKLIYSIDKCRVNPINKTQGQFKVDRGGSWHYTEGYPATVSFRSFDLSSAKYSDLGFRCANDGRQDNILEQNVDKLKDKFKESLGAKIPSDIPIDIEQAEIDNALNGNFDDVNADSIDMSQVSGMAKSKLGGVIPADVSELGVNPSSIENAISGDK